MVINELIIEGKASKSLDKSGADRSEILREKQCQKIPSKLRRARRSRIQSRELLTSGGQERGISTGGEDVVMVEEEEQQAMVAASSVE